MTRMSIVLAVALTVTGPVAGQTLPTADAVRQFDEYAGKAVRDWSVPGLAIAVVSGDSVVFAKGYGVRTLGRPEPVTAHTIFANGSTTKAFTSMVAAMMVDEGALSWDDFVIDHMPAFRLGDPDATTHLTIRHLLSHRTGFGDPGYLWYGVPDTFDGILARLRYLSPSDGWNTTYAYNNVTYSTAGTIAAEAAGTDWATMVQERILQPLGMTETFTNTAVADAWRDVATPHDRINGTMRPIERYDVDNIAPAGVMYSSVLDMSRWMRFLLDTARVNGRAPALVSQEAFNELFTMQTIVPLSSFYPTASLTKPHFVAYGMGWFLEDYRGEKVAFHTGSIDGMSAIVGLVPERMIGVVVFANSDHAEVRHPLMYRGFDLVLGGPPRDWSGEMHVMYDSLAQEAAASRQETEGRRVAHTTPTLGLEAYVGTYEDPLYGTVQVTVTGDHLTLSRSAFLTATLGHWHYDTFETEWEKPWIGKDLVTFVLDDARTTVTALQVDDFTLEKAGSP
jgi:CubicO group peptidase (beta-lactamase class C family)